MHVQKPEVFQNHKNLKCAVLEDQIYITILLPSPQISIVKREIMIILGDGGTAV